MELPQNYLDIIKTWHTSNHSIGTRAEKTIRFILKDIEGSKRKDKYHASPLTFTGSPFEPAFSFSTDDVRYTIAASPAEVKKVNRLDHALEILKSLHRNSINHMLLSELKAIQAQGPLTYGAQIGVRHTLNKDSYKLYIELPLEAKEDSEKVATRILGNDPILLQDERNAYPTLLGINLETQEKEVYYRVENLHPQEIRTILSRANAVGRFEEILSFLNETQDTPIRHVLPGNTWGYSYSIDPTKTITCSIYTFAKTLFGPDGWVRDRVLKMGQKKSWNIDSYSEISKSLENNRDNMHHGIFGIVLPPNRPAAAWVGISPIEPQYV